MKRLFDIILRFFLLVLVIPFLFLFFIPSFKLFKQTRIGRYASPFTIYKLQTMVEERVTTHGMFLRKYKIDELPQLYNILKGDMSFVGPRPDIPGYYDQLTEEDRKILELRPGLTSLAAIKYRNEEQLLRSKEDPMDYNDTVLFPDKVRMNLEYYKKQSFVYDLYIIFLTIKSIFAS